MLNIKFMLYLIKRAYEHGIKSNSEKLWESVSVDSFFPLNVTGNSRTS